MKNSAKYILLTFFISFSLLTILSSCEELLNVLSGSAVSNNGRAIAGADVILDNGMGDAINAFRTTVTANDGSYSFSDLPSGNYDIYIIKGSFRDTIRQFFVGEDGTFLAGSSKLLTAKKMGFYPGNDSIQKIVRDTLGYSLERLLLSDFTPTNLQNYSIIFLNSTQDLSSPTVGNAVANFLNSGGSVYASNESKSCLAEVPGLEIGSAAGCQGGTFQQSLASTVTNSSLSAFLGKSNCTINYLSQGWFSLDSSVTVADYMDASYDDDCGEFQTPQNRPQVLHERYGLNSGRVIYNTFRNEPQQTQDAINIMKFLIFEL